MLIIPPLHFFCGLITFATANLFPPNSGGHRDQIPFSIEFTSNIGKLDDIAEYAITAVANAPTPLSQMNRELGAWQMIFRPRGAYNEGADPIFLMDFVLISPQG